MKYAMMRVIGEAMARIIRNQRGIELRNYSWSVPAATNGVGFSSFRIDSVNNPV